MILEANALLTSFSHLKNIADAMLGLRDSVKLNEKIIELQSAIMSAQQQAMVIQQSYAALDAARRDLETECMRLKDWSAEKQNYAIRQIAFGVFAYVQKNIMSKFTGAEKYCSNCFDRGEKSLLQISQESHSSYYLLACPRCNFKVTISHFY